jgi:CBS domain-containing protein
MDETVMPVELDTPLLEAVRLMVTHGQISLPVMHRGELVGVLRDRALVLEITRCISSGW